MTRKNIVYLYSEVMPYTIVVMRAIVAKFDINILCIKWDENKRTPFVPENADGISFFNRSSFDEKTICCFLDDAKPGLVYVSGRMDKLYLHAAKHAKKLGVPTVTGSDNQWSGSAKNWLAALLGYFLYKQYFNYIWVAGTPQYEFARRIGYRKDKILKYTYSADVRAFNAAYIESCSTKQQQYPHVIAFVGRFIKIKGIDLLIEAFTEIKQEFPNDWKLVLVGSGSLSTNIAGNKCIEIKDFMDSNSLAETTKDWGAFCLPSDKEPWGVVLHEFAAAGLPVIASDMVGAADTFLLDGYNGFSFRAGDKGSLKNALHNLFFTTDEKLMELGRRSKEMSTVITPEKSAYSLMQLLN